MEIQIKKHTKATLIIKKKKITSVGENVKGISCSDDGNVTVCYCWKTVHRILKEIKNRMNSMSSNNPTYGYLSKENKNINLKRYLNLHVHCSIIFTIVKTQK